MMCIYKKEIFYFILHQGMDKKELSVIRVKYFILISIDLRIIII